VALPLAKRWVAEHGPVLAAPPPLMSVALLEREAGIHGAVVMGAGGVLMPRVLGEGRLKLPA
jgi:hypothetical protein